MSWIRLDDKRALNLKVTAAGFAARGLDEAAICLSASLETDGKITHGMLATLAAAHGSTMRATLALADILIRPGPAGGCGRWEPVDDGWMIHDYLKYNPSREASEATRDEISKARARAGQIGGIKSGEARRKAKPKQSASKQTEANADEASNPRPDPSASNEAETGRDALPPDGRRPPRRPQPPPPTVPVAVLEAETADLLAKAEACGKCDKGFIEVGNGYAKCPCQNGNHP